MRYNYLAAEETSAERIGSPAILGEGMRWNGLITALIGEKTLQLHRAYVRKDCTGRVVGHTTAVSSWRGVRQKIPENRFNLEENEELIHIRQNLKDNAVLSGRTDAAI
ncbi:hypothetical protein Bbelb_211260 [Branchiostoma belcheri]|nr:hypothetical protein Bbelb_211260 [Branchiostoma belcheri]